MSKKTDAIFDVLLWLIIVWLVWGISGKLANGATPADAAQAALVDLQGLPPELWPTTRYLWIHRDTAATGASVAFTIDIVSRSNVSVRSVSTAAGALVRLDLATIAPRADDLLSWALVWESFAEDEPYFTVRSDLFEQVSVPPWRFKGKWWTARTIRVASQAPHAPALAELAAATGSVVPIVRADWFVTKALSSIRDQGGRYYEFLGIQQLDLSGYLRSRGASEQQVLGLRSEERSARFFSNITAKTRRIRVFMGAGVRPSTGIGIVAITQDVGDGDVGAESDPIRNLGDFKVRAQEVIVVRASGFHEFTLWDAEGRLQEVVPPDVAVDHMIPAPYTRQLQAAIGCIRCHGPDDGWKPFTNDIQTMLRSGLDVFADLGSGRPTADALAILAGQYGGDLSEPLRIGRNYYQRQVLASTGLGVAQASEAVAAAWASYHYQRVTPLVAYLELGGAMADLGDDAEDTEVAAAALRGIIRPIVVDELGVSAEDAILAALMAGLTVNRSQWEQIYADAMLRTVPRPGLD